jgi:hypothetical protein
MLHQNALQAARITELGEHLAVVIRQKGRKRKRLQTGGTLEFSPTADQVSAQSSVTIQQSTKARRGGEQDGGQPTQRRCEKCRGIGHNVRTCQVNSAKSSESEASAQCIVSDSSDDGLDKIES